VKKNDYKMCQLLLCGGYSSDEKKKDSSWTTEKIDTEHSHSKWKSDPNRGDFFNRTPLFLAVKNCNSQIVKLLLSHKAIPSIKSSAGNSSLSICREKVAMYEFQIEQTHQ